MFTSSLTKQARVATDPIAISRPHIHISSDALAFVSIHLHHSLTHLPFNITHIAMSSASLPELTYPYEGLEPFISRQIMELHHKKHHQTYVNALNAAEQSYAKAGSPKERIALQQAIKFNGGGHINHSLFWKNLAPASSEGRGVGGQLKGTFT
jgi:hypothetical protein